MQTEGAISAMETDLLALTDWLETNRTQLADLSDLVSGDLNKLERKVIVALVTTDVHARDIVEELKEANVNSVFDFNWQKQLRYYWDDEKEDCSIK
jgi:dynein heavy chain